MMLFLHKLRRMVLSPIPLALMHLALTSCSTGNTSRSRSGAKNDGENVDPVCPADTYERTQVAASSCQRVVQEDETCSGLDLTMDLQDPESLKVALRKQVRVLQGNADAASKLNRFVRGENGQSGEEIDQAKLVAAHQQLLTELEQGRLAEPSALRSYIMKHFRCMVVSAQSGQANQRPTSGFTGYYTPEIEVSEQQNANYSVPIFKEGKELTAAQLHSSPRPRSSVLAYAKYLTDSSLCQIQGHCVSVYPDGRKECFGYAGGNGQDFYPYLRAQRVQNGGKPAIEEITSGLGAPHNDPLSNGMASAAPALRALEDSGAAGKENACRLINTNPSYAFLQKRDANLNASLESCAVGASGVSMVPLRSVAAGEDLPLGALLFYKVSHPNGGNQAHLASVLDRGGAIQCARIDIYTGVGQQGLALAGPLTANQGTLMVLTPRKEPRDDAAATATPVNNNPGDTSPGNSDTDSNPPALPLCHPSKQSLPPVCPKIRISAAPATTS